MERKNNKKFDAINFENFDAPDELPQLRTVTNHILRRVWLFSHHFSFHRTVALLRQLRLHSNLNSPSSSSSSLSLNSFVSRELVKKLKAYNEHTAAAAVWAQREWKNSVQITWVFIFSSTVVQTRSRKKVNRAEKRRKKEWTNENPSQPDIQCLFSLSSCCSASDWRLLVLLRAQSSLSVFQSANGHRKTKIVTIFVGQLTTEIEKIATRSWVKWFDWNKKK